MASKYKRYNDNKSNVISYLVFGTAIVLAGILAYFVIYHNINKEEFDQQTLCSKKNDIYSKHIILLDITDKYNFMQINDIKQNIMNIIKNLDEGEQVKVYFLRDEINPEESAALNICNPGKGDNESFIFSNPKLIEKKWQNQFFKPLSNTISLIENKKSFNYSPIIEMVQWLNILEFKNRTNDSNNKLTIISDMIQNSKEFSFFRNKITNFNESMFYNKYRTNMSNSQVQIMITRRDKLTKFQDKNFRDFWVNYFSIQNARIDKILRIDG